MDISLKETTDIERYLLDLLDDHSAAVKPDISLDHTEKRFTFGLYDGEEIIGGLIAKEVLGEFYISLLAISKDYRKHGLGRRLMTAAEQKARERNCHHLLLTTYSYQGANFYPKLGYTQLAKIPDYPVPGIDKIYFIKYL